MAREILPGGQLAVKILLVGVGESAEPQIPVVRVGAVELEAIVFGLAGFEHRRILEAVAEAKGAVVVEVVTQELVGGRCLLDGGFQGGVWIERGHDGGPTVVRGAGDPGAAVVIGDVLDQPVDGVPGVGGLVDAFGVVRLVGRAAHDECAFRLEPPANVLLHHVVILVAPARRGRHAALGGFLCGHAIRGAVDEKGQRALVISGREDYGLKPDPVAHGNHDFLEVDRDAVIRCLG